MVVYIRLLKESLSFAITALRKNKLRTLLSLLGITIGIFSIIAILTAVDSLDRKIKQDLSSLDKNTIYLFNHSFGPTEIPRWKVEQFPDVTYEEYLYLKNNLNDAENVCFQLMTKPETIKFETKSVNSLNVVPVSDEFDDIQKLEFKLGRFFNESESNSGLPLVVLGHDVSKQLFDGYDPIGQKVRLYGQKFTVIGTLKKQGEGIFGDSNDTSIFIPSNFMRKKYGDNADFLTPLIVIKPNKNIDIEAFKGDISQKVRKLRGIKTGDIDNFFINVLSGFTDFLDSIIDNLNIGGWLIAGLSLLVGGFGIANIMFVSVKERTNLIGIQKSLGAKNKFILFQFLFEAVILCIIGGIMGMVFVYIISIVLTNVLDFEFVLGFNNVLIGTGLAILIGLVSGILPAISASKLDPVEAIRSGM
jgi:putative ABC transport system permease protein